VTPPAKLVGILFVAPFLPSIARAFRAVQPDMAKTAAELHIAFNATLAFVFIGALDPLAWLLVRVFPPESRLPILRHRATSTIACSIRSCRRWLVPRAKRCTSSSRCADGK
jgi:Na+/phosphate symporter